MLWSHVSVRSKLPPNDLSLWIIGKAAARQACLLFTVVARGFQVFVLLSQVDLVFVFFGIFILDHSKYRKSSKGQDACFSPARMMCRQLITFKIIVLWLLIFFENLKKNYLISFITYLTVVVMIIVVYVTPLCKLSCKIQILVNY